MSTARITVAIVSVWIGLGKPMLNIETTELCHSGSRRLTPRSRKVDFVAFAFNLDLPAFLVLSAPAK